MALLTGKTFLSEFLATNFLKRIFACGFRNGNIHIGDEIVSILGRKLGELSMMQVQRLMVDCTNGTGQTKIDLVICRSDTNLKDAQTKDGRKHSADSYLSDFNGHGIGNNNFASIALRYAFIY